MADRDGAQHIFLVFELQQAELLATVGDFKAPGIELGQPEERIDNSSTVCKPVFRAFGVIAHFGRWPVSERTRESIAAARSVR